MFYYFTYVACGVFLICLAYAAYAILGRLVALRSLRQLAFRVQMLSRGRTARLGSLLNAHPLVLFFSDQLSIELDASSPTWSAVAGSKPPTTTRGSICRSHSTGSSC